MPVVRQLEVQQPIRGPARGPPLSLVIPPGPLSLGGKEFIGMYIFPKSTPQPSLPSQGAQPSGFLHRGMVARSGFSPSLFLWSSCLPESHDLYKEEIPRKAMEQREARVWGVGHGGEAVENTLTAPETCLHLYRNSGGSRHPCLVLLTIPFTRLMASGCRSHGRDGRKTPSRKWQSCLSAPHNCVCTAMAWELGDLVTLWAVITKRSKTI